MKSDERSKIINSMQINFLKRESYISCFGNSAAGGECNTY